MAVAIGQGKSNAQIAAELYMGLPTVKTHVSRILAKLALNNRVQIALLAHDAGEAAGTFEPGGSELDFQPHQGTILAGLKIKPKGGRYSGRSSCHPSE